MSGGLTLSVSPAQSGVAPFHITLTNHNPPSGITPPGGAFAQYNQYLVDWRDGSAISALFVGSGGDELVDHIFTKPGSYDVHVYSSWWDNDTNMLGDNDGVITVVVTAVPVPLSAAARTRLVRFS
jgi:hypothetical protein